MSTLVDNPERSILGPNARRQYRRAFVAGYDADERGRAVRASFGLDDGWRFNEWKPLWQSMPGAIIGPVTLKIELGDPADWFDTEHLAVVWRSEGADAVDYEPAAELQTVQEGTTVAIPITEVKGDVLEVWCSDGLDVTVSVLPIEELAVAKAEAAKSRREQESILPSLESGSTAGVVLAGLAVVVAGLVVYGIVATPGALDNVAGAAGA